MYHQIIINEIISIQSTIMFVHIQKNEFQLNARLIQSTQYASGSNLATRCSQDAAVFSGYIAPDSIISGIIKKLFISWKPWKSGINDAMIIPNAANNIETQIMNKIVTIIHHIHGKLIHQKMSSIISNINHCKNHVVAHQSVLHIIMSTLLFGETKHSFMNQSSLSQMISIHEASDPIIVLIAMIQAARNHM